MVDRKKAHNLAAAFHVNTQQSMNVSDRLSRLQGLSGALWNLTVLDRGRNIPSAFFKRLHSARKALNAWASLQMNESSCPSDLRFTRKANEWLLMALSYKLVYPTRTSAKIHISFLPRQWDVGELGRLELQVGRQGHCSDQ